MTHKFKNKYRIPSARAPFWNYGWNAAYFVTICTKNRVCWFGDVVNGVMELSPMGHIANSCWHQIPLHFPFVELCEHIIMPKIMYMELSLSINRMTDVMMDVTMNRVMDVT